MRSKVILKRYKGDKEIRRCRVCKDFKVSTLFYKNGKYYRTECKACNDERREKQRDKGRGMYLYLIKVDGFIRWFGRTKNVKERINNHRKINSDFKKRCIANEIDLSKSKNEIYVCNIGNQGLDLDINQIENIEHYWIRRFIELGQPLLNIKTAHTLKVKERYIDQTTCFLELNFEKRDDLKLV